MPVARKLSRARQHQIAKPRQTCHCLDSRSLRKSETRHLGKPARYDSGHRVRTKAQSADSARRYGYDILARLVTQPFRNAADVTPQPNGGNRTR